MVAIIEPFETGVLFFNRKFWIYRSLEIFGHSRDISLGVHLKKKTGIFDFCERDGDWDDGQLAKMTPLRLVITSDYRNNL